MSLSSLGFDPRALVAKLTAAGVCTMNARPNTRGRPPKGAVYGYSMKPAAIRLRRYRARHKAAAAAKNLCTSPNTSGPCATPMATTSTSAP